MTGFKWLDAFLVAAAFIVGVLVGREQIQEKFDLAKATWERDQAQAVAAAETAIREQLEGVIRLGDTLTDRLIRTETDLKKTTQEKNRVLNQLTTGRACLDSAVVRVLNESTDTGPGLKPVSAPSGLSLAAHGASAAAEPSQGGRSPLGGQRASGERGGESLTDTDVAEWIVIAQQQDRICRARLDALIDFEEQRP